MIPPPRETAIAWRPIELHEPLDALPRLRGAGHAWLLDSALRRSEGGGPSAGVASFLGAAPHAVARIRGRHLELEVLRQADPRFPVGRHRFEGDPLELLRRVLPAPPPGPAPPFAFCGGAVGYLGYELAEQLDAHVLHARDDLGLPDALLLLVDRVLAIDHESGVAFAAGIGMGEGRTDAERGAEAALRGLASALRGPAAAGAHAEPGPPARPTRPTRRQPRAHAFDSTAYAKAVDEIKQQIARGNVYQACLTARAGRPFAGDPWRLYRTLRRLDPAPFACFLELPELSLVGSSPERFLRVDRAGGVESRPIKGTARRGLDPVEDAARRDALLRSEKDRAENLMIVDLVRNDLGRVCETGSVDVPELMAVEAYANVFQLVSTVRGRLAAGRDAFDAVRATFPPGSMTGAPKIAAMALLDRLEPVRRAVYSGAIGYFDVHGGADLSVVIRTALLKDGCAWLHAGGGVVADSEPGAEVREALDKLAPLFRALERAEGRVRPTAICWPPGAADGTPGDE